MSTSPDADDETISREEVLARFDALRPEALLGEKEQEAPTNEALPHIWVQWKGTDACFDFWCECVGEDPDENSGHGDVSNAYAIRCARCGRQYDLPQTLPLLPFSGKFTPVTIGGFDE